MALPVIETPRYELTLPSQDVKVQYRPFLVKEEKILMMGGRWYFPRILNLKISQMMKRDNLCLQ